MTLPKQVFSAFDYKEVARIDHLKFCPICGSTCKLKKISKKMRSVCTKPECGFIHFVNPSPGVSVLIENDGNVLLGKRAKGESAAGLWCLPCGFIEYEENFLTAACREVKEETGLDIKINSIINVVSNYLSPQLHTLVIVFAAKVIGGVLTPGDDIKALKWFSEQGPFPKLAFLADIHILKRYFKEKIKGTPVDPNYSTYRKK